MAQSSVLTLLPQVPQGTTAIQGTKYPACAYYLSNKDLQTLTWSVTACTGILTIEASLVDDPQDADWFSVHEITFATSTESGYTNLTGNFVWIRATLTEHTTGVLNHVRLVY